MRTRMKFPVKGRITSMIALGLALLIGMNVIYVALLMRNETAQLNTYLTELTDKTALAFQDKLEGYISSLQSVAALLNQIDDQEATERSLRQCLQTGQFSRFGVIDRAGAGYGVDRTAGSIQWNDFSQEGYFQTALSGRVYVSGLKDDKFSPNQIVLISVPIPGGQGGPAGVLCGVEEYDTFQRDLEVPILNGKGFYHIVASDGSLIFRSNLSQMDKEIENLFRIPVKDDKTMETMTRDMVRGASGCGLLRMVNGEDKYVAYTPVGINDWYIITVMPASVVTLRQYTIFFASLFVMMITSLAFAGLMVGINRIYHNSIQKMEKLETFDPLTGGYNKSKFLKEAEATLKNATGDWVLAVYDLKDFRALNTQFGYQQGDQVIAALSEKLIEALQEGEVVGHYVGDMFYALLRRDDRLISRVETMFAAVYEAVGLVLGFRYPVTSRCAMCPVDLGGEYDLNVLLDNTLVTRLSLLENHEDTWAFYEKSLGEKLLRRSMIELEMHRALRDREFQIYVQGKVDIQNPYQPVCGMEALCRWQRQDGSWISPGEFISVFEENGFITELDLYMLEGVCAWLHRRLEQGLPVVPVSVNQSRKNCYRSDQVDRILSVVERYQIPHHLLEFEVTESALVEDVTLVQAQFRSLRELGFRTSIDDFGAGASALNVMKDFEVDVIKIDGEFFGEAWDTEKGRAVVCRIVDFLRQLGCTVLAEGVENMEQVALLRVCGCDYVQGYVFSKPQPIDAFAEDILDA